MRNWRRIERNNNNNKKQKKHTEEFLSHLITHLRRTSYSSGATSARNYTIVAATIRLSVGKLRHHNIITQHNVPLPQNNNYTTYYYNHVNTWRAKKSPIRLVAPTRSKTIHRILYVYTDRRI